jgi:predicted HicB family RNase H-like nuclease
MDTIAALVVDLIEWFKNSQWIGKSIIRGTEVHNQIEALISKAKEKKTTITIDIPDDVFITLALMAHEQDITLNQLITNILLEYIEKHENKRA